MAGNTVVVLTHETNYIGQVLEWFEAQAFVVVRTADELWDEPHYDSVATESIELGTRVERELRIQDIVRGWYALSTYIRQQVGQHLIDLPLPPR